MIKRYASRTALLVALALTLSACPSIAPVTHVFIYYASASRVCTDGVRVTANGFGFSLAEYVSGFNTSESVSTPVPTEGNTAYVLTKLALAPATPDEALAVPYPAPLSWDGVYRHLVRGEGSGFYSFQCLGASGREKLDGPGMSWRPLDPLYAFVVVEDAVSPSGLRVTPARR